MHLYGYIRIGTLHDFRRTEHAKGISDPKEGKKSISHSIDKLEVNHANRETQQSNPDLLALEKLGMVQIGRTGTLVVRDVKLQHDFDSQDCFIYCLSHQYSADMYGLFGDADMCLEITDLDNFFSCITHELKKIHPINFSGVSKVSYQKRNGKWNGSDLGSDPILIKEDIPCYRDQKELRAVWKTPPGIHIGVEFIICKDLYKYFKVHSKK
jgi:hypothetical protein